MLVIKGSICNEAMDLARVVMGCGNNSFFSYVEGSSLERIAGRVHWSGRFLIWWLRSSRFWSLLTSNKRLKYFIIVKGKYRI